MRSGAIMRGRCSWERVLCGTTYVHPFLPSPPTHLPTNTSQTQSDLWKNRTTNLLSTIVFDYFPDGIMKDICEQNNACNVDQHSFKAYLSRWLAATTQM